MSDMPPLALLAGGLATRLHPLTASQPKAMLEVAGEPFIAHQLRLIRRERIKRVVLCVGYLWERIEAFVGDGEKFGLEVVYCIDGPTLLGTGGAIRKALPDLGDEFLIMYGDTWLDCAYAPVVASFRSSRKPALMTVYRNEDKWDKSNVWFEAGAVRCYDKKLHLPQMRHIDWGLSVAKAELFAREPAGRSFDLTETLGSLSKTGELAGFEVSTRFYEIGSIEGLHEIDALLRRQN